MSAFGQTGRSVSLATVPSWTRNVGIAALNLGALLLGGSVAYAENLAATPLSPGASSADSVQSAPVPSPIPTGETPTRTIPNGSNDNQELTAEAPKPVPVAQAAAASPEKTNATPRQHKPAPAVGCSCPCASQDTPSEPVRLDPFRRQPGYGLTLLGADLINLTGHLTIGVLAGEKQGFKDAWPYTLTGLYLLSGPIVHLAYGRPAKAALSLGVRTTVPLAFALLGGLVAPERSTWAVGGAVGAATAIIFDAAVLGRGDYVGVPTGRLLPLTVPWVDHTRRSAGVDLAWAF